MSDSDECGCGQYRYRDAHTHAMTVAELAHLLVTLPDAATVLFSDESIAIFVGDDLIAQIDETGMSDEGKR